MSIRIEVPPQARDHVPGVTPPRPLPETDGRRGTVEIGFRRRDRSAPPRSSREAAMPVVTLQMIIPIAAIGFGFTRLWLQMLGLIPPDDFTAAFDL